MTFTLTDACMKNAYCLVLYVVNIFPNIDNKMGVESVKNMFLIRDNNIPPAECIVETELFLNCRNSNFNNQHYLHVHSFTQGVHMSCSFSDIDMYSYDLKVLIYEANVKCWKRFHDGNFVS